MTTDKAQLSDEVDAVKAERDRAVVMLRKLVRQLEHVGGYMTHEQQTELREARAFIEAYAVIEEASCE